jgi:adenosine deaminase
VFDLNARRIGHALSLGKSPELRRSIADRGIAVEMCPYANIQIRGYPLDQAGAEGSYPLLDYLRSGIRVTINTDNIGISGASLTDNLLLAGWLCPGLTRLDLLRCLRHAIETAFVSAPHRAQLIRQFSSAIPLP